MDDGIHLAKLDCDQFLLAIAEARYDAIHGTGDATLEFVVLGSSSAGNTSFLRVETAHGARQLLIDGGLSPKATRGFLALLGHDLAATDDLLFTHFDHDHAKAGWARAAMCENSAAIKPPPTRTMRPGSASSARKPSLSIK